MTYKLCLTQFASADPLLCDVLASHALDIGNPPTVSEPVMNEATAIRVVADINCTIAIGEDPTVSKLGPIRLSANVPETFGVKPNDRVAVIIR